MRGAAVELISRAPCAMKKPVQQAAFAKPPGPDPRLVVLKLLPFTAENNGPARDKVVGPPAARDRLSVRTLPAVSWVTPSYARNGPVPVLTTIALSPMKRNGWVFRVGSPLATDVFTALNSGPESVTVGGRPTPEAMEITLPPAPGGGPVPAVREPPLNEMSVPVPLSVKEEPVKNPNAFS